MKNTVSIICDRCKFPVDGRGYSADLSVEGDDVHVAFQRGIDLQKNNHYCGKQCLMLVINGCVDAVSGIRSVAA